MIAPFDKNRSLLLRAMNGIGDMCWVLAMVARAKELLGIPSLVIKMQQAGDFRDGRALEFVRRFSFVDFVFSEHFEVRADPAISGSKINYVSSGYNQDRTQYTLIPNGFVEWQTRLEAIMPDLPCDWSFLKTKYAVDETGWRMARDLEKPGRLLGQPSRGYVCLHLGTASDNRLAGQNIGSVWGPKHWRELLSLLQAETDLPIVVLGAEYDRSFAEQICGDGVTNLCGKTTAGQVIEVLRHASLFVSFPSGLAIAAVYMGTPTVCFWNPEGRSVSTTESYWFSDAFATNWAPPRAKHYLPAVYGRDDCESVFAKIREVLQ